MKVSSVLVAAAAVVSMQICATALAEAARGKIIHPASATVGEVHDYPACIDWDASEGSIFKAAGWDTDYRHFGSRLHVYEKCPGDDNQRWFIEGPSIYTLVPKRKAGENAASDVTKFCMDLNRDKMIEGKGYEIIGWDDCHGSEIQQFTIHEDKTITVNLDKKPYCLDVAGDGSVIAAECTGSPSQKWSFMD